MQDTYTINGRKYKANKEQLRQIKLASEKFQQDLQSFDKVVPGNKKCLDAGQNYYFPVWYKFMGEVCKILDCGESVVLERQKKTYLNQFNLDELPEIPE